MEFRSKERVLMESNSLNRYIENVPQKVQNTKINQQQTIEAKYSHLLSSMKPVHLLIEKYRKKINLFINQLEGKHKIKEISREIQLYSIRAKEMEQLEKQLDLQVEKQRKLEEERRQSAKQIRQKLKALKMQNANISYQIQLENIRIQQQNKKKKVKVQRQPLFPQQTTSEKQIRLLQSTQFTLQKQLFNQVHQKILINRIFIDGIKLIRTSLKQSQKKSHQQGLVGSMYFKLSQPQKQNKPHLQLKMNNDFRSLVYNTLKTKYNGVIKKSKQVPIQVQSQRFLSFNKLQTIGVLELKPESFNILKYIAELRIGQILLIYQFSN